MKLVSAAFLLLSTVYHQHFLAYFPSDNRMSADLTFIFITSNKQENLQNVGARFQTRDPLVSSPRH